MKVIRQKFISREDLKANPNIIYLFGDNLQRKGFGGQAAAMRGEPNAIGIPTKHKPLRDADAYFTDETLNANIQAIRVAFARIPPNSIVVVPLDGLGTGLAELEKRAPQTFAYLQRCLAELEIER